MSTIICADNEMSTLNRYEEVFGEEGYRVHLCTSADEVLETCANYPADLLILPIDCFDNQLLRHGLTDDKDGSKKPVIVVAAKNDVDRIVDAVRNGADDYLTKPIEKSELLTKLRVVFARNVPQADVAPEQPESEDNLFAGTFTLLKVLGSGSHCTVYHAVDNTRAEPVEVALKVLDIDAYKNIGSTFSSYFLREAYELSRLEHPNIIRLIDFGKFKDSYFLAMEYVDGQSLDAAINKSGPMDSSSLLMLAYHLALALVYLDAHHVVHRDIKPANIMIDRIGSVKLTDFGLAKQQNDTSLTMRHDQLMCTPQFCSPEQILCEDELDIRCDIYSLGATLYYCGTKEFPFPGKTVMDILDSNMNHMPEPMDVVNPKIDGVFSDIVMKMIAKKKSDRFTPAELKANLDSIIH